MEENLAVSSYNNLNEILDQKSKMFDGQEKSCQLGS